MEFGLYWPENNWVRYRTSHRPIPIPVSNPILGVCRRTDVLVIWWYIGPVGLCSIYAPTSYCIRYWSTVDSGFPLIMIMAIIVSMPNHGSSTAECSLLPEQHASFRRLLGSHVRTVLGTCLSNLKFAVFNVLVFVRSTESGSFTFGRNRK